MGARRCAWLSIAFALFSSAIFEKAALADDAGFGPADPNATGSSESGLEFHIDAAYMLSAGRFAPGERIASRSPLLFPFGLDIGYRFNPRWFLGIHGLYAFGLKSRESRHHEQDDSIDSDWSLRGECPDCTHNLVRVGLVGEYRERLTPSLRLVFGLRSSAEFFNTTLDQRQQRSRRAMGWEILEAHVASEWNITTGLDVGPIVALGGGTFWNEVQICSNPNRYYEERGCPTAERSESGGIKRDLDHAGFHLWFSAGLRVVILP